MTAAKIPSAGLIWLFGFLYILGYSCQLCQGKDIFGYKLNQVKTDSYKIKPSLFIFYESVF